VVFGICLVPISAIALTVDDPLTPYNESETPISLSTPVCVNTDASQVITQVGRPLTISQDLRTNRSVAAMFSSATATIHISHSRLDFLDALLC
jgi:hypothetical protein